MKNLQRIVHMVFGLLALGFGVYLVQSDRLAGLLSKGYAPAWWQAGISIAFIAGGAIVLLHSWKKIGLLFLTTGYLVTGLSTGILLGMGYWYW